MKRIGIIAAMDEELEAIKEIMTDTFINKIYELEFIQGKINEKEVVAVKCGVGKVNAARTTQILIDNFDIHYIINVGTAGSLNEKLEIGDIIIANKLVQHDFDITAGGKHERGYISGIGTYFSSDDKLIDKAKQVIDNIERDITAKIGIIATGDVFCSKIEMKEDIIKTFHADCVDMEAAAIAQVCILDKIPFIVIRAVSDKPNGHNEVDFEQYLNIVSRRYAKFIDFFIK